MEGSWEELAEMTEEIDAKIAKFDATTDSNVITKFKINEYPTIYFLHNDMLYKYTGRRRVENFVDFVTGGYAQEEGKKVPYVGLGFFETLYRVPLEDAFMAFGIGASLAMLLLGCLVYCGDGGNDSEIEKTLASIREAKAKKEEKQKPKGKKGDKKEPVEESKKDR